MPSTTQPTDFSDLYTDLLNRVQEDTSVTATSDQAKRYINTALYDMHVGYGERFPWAERRAVLRTQDEYSTGTVTITKGSTTLTGTGTAWDTDTGFGVNNTRAGGKITINGSFEVYEVQSVSSDTSITLADRFIDDDVTDGSYNYFEDEYALASDFLKPIDQQMFCDEVPIRFVSRTEFRRLFPANRVTGRPRVAILLDLPFSGNTTPVRKVKLHPPPSDIFLLPYAYVTSNLAVSSAGTAKAQLSSDDDEPIVPLRYRHAIVLHALQNWYRDQRNDTRSQAAGAAYTDMLLRMSSDTEVGAQRAHLRNSFHGYHARAKHPWRGGGRRFDINNRFDRLEDL